MNKIITKWIEPYILLEKIKNSCEMKNFIFNGGNKNQIKKNFIEGLEQKNTFGLYMKNVNQFYLFKGDIDINKLFDLTENDIKEVEDYQTVLDMIDLGKAEAGFISF